MPHCIQCFAPALPTVCQLCPYTWQSCKERSTAIEWRCGLGAVLECWMRISSSRKVFMNSSAFHALTGQAFRGILPLDLSLSWQEKRHTKPSYCHCVTTVQRDFGFSVWIAATLVSLARHTQYLNSRSLGNAWASCSGVSWHHLLNLAGQSAKTTPSRSV